VTPKRSVPIIFDATHAAQIYEHGALTVAGSPPASDIQLVAIGAYQLIEALRAHSRLEQRGYRVCVTAMVEPSRFREPRDNLEAQCTLEDKEVDGLCPRV
jgi:phosphoketolase